MRFINHGVCGATLILAAGGAAAAESSVTLYGVVDANIQYLDNGGVHSYAEKSGGSTGSLFGLKGTEDLGGGLSAQFNVETGFNVNNGGLFADTSALFYRQAWVGLSDAEIRSLTMGASTSRVSGSSIRPIRFARTKCCRRFRQTSSRRSEHAVDAIRFRPRQQFDHVSIAGSEGPEVYGMYAFSATVSQPIPATTGNMLNVGATYSGYGFYAGLAYVNQHPGQETIAGLPTSLSLLGTEHFIGALAYRIGIVNFQFNYSTTARRTRRQGRWRAPGHRPFAEYCGVGRNDPGNPGRRDHDCRRSAQRARRA
jgi:Outer membrane protein (porin)